MKRKGKVMIKMRIVHFYVTSNLRNKTKNLIVYEVEEAGITTKKIKTRKWQLEYSPAQTSWENSEAQCLESHKKMVTLRECSAQEIERKLRHAFLKPKTKKIKGIPLKAITDAIADLSAHKSFSEADFDGDVIMARNQLHKAGANPEQMKIFETGVVSASEKQNWPASRRYQGNGG